MEENLMGDTLENLPNPEVKYAGFWVRYVAYVFDFILISFIINFILKLLGITFNPYDLESIEGLSLYWEFLKAQMFMVFLFHGVFAYMESSKLQATFGKMMFKLKVTDLNGERITFLRSLGRTYGKYISILTFFIGFLMVVFTNKKQGLHDKISNCLVVKK